MERRIGEILGILAGVIFLVSCSDTPGEVSTQAENFTNIENTFEGRIQVDALDNYARQEIPGYIQQDNAGGNPVTDAGATLGRVLFYDKNLSLDNSISCASCHQQQHAFSDTQIASTGVNGTTGRHSMRLVNARFSAERRFFWDERAGDLEAQTTQPIQDHIEMGFSGQEGDPGIDELINRLEGIGYYRELFELAYGDAGITEERMQTALAQFVRSIQSFDSKYDEGRGQVNNDQQDFPNFTPGENLGKRLFMDPPGQGGAGCAGCHRAPEFDIDPNTLNNGVVGRITDDEALDLEVTRSPTLRDLVGPTGSSNGPFMHDGSLATLQEVLEHYDRIMIDPGNTNLDRRLAGRGGGQNLQLTDEEKNAIIAFLHTLSGTAVYTDEKWSNPFNN